MDYLKQWKKVEDKFRSANSHHQSAATLLLQNVCIHVEYRKGTLFQILRSQ